MLVPYAKSSKFQFIPLPLCNQFVKIWIGDLEKYLRRTPSPYRLSYGGWTNWRLKALQHQGSKGQDHGTTTILPGRQGTSPLLSCPRKTAPERCPNESPSTWFRPPTKRLINDGSRQVWIGSKGYDRRGKCCYGRQWGRQEAELGGIRESNR